MRNSKEVKAMKNIIFEEGETKMGRTGTYNYEVQVEKETGSLTIQGAMGFKEAFNVLIEEIIRVKGNDGYIWPQTQTARNYFSNHYKGFDFVKVTPQGNITGMKIGLV